MPTGDPFEAYRWKREIERMEKDFRESANARRERLEQLSQGEDDTLEFERKVAVEMQDFLSESVSAAERVLTDISEGGAGDAENEIREKLEALIAGAAPPTGEVDVTGKDAAASIRRRALERKTGRKPVDLRAALTRIRRSSDAAPDLPPEPAGQESAEPPSRSQLLATFDATCHQVTHLLRARMGEDSVEVAQPISEPPPASAGKVEDELTALRVEVSRLRRVVDALVRKGVLAESDLS